MKPLIIAALLATAWATPGCAARQRDAAMEACQTLTDFGEWVSPPCPEPPPGAVAIYLHGKLLGWGIPKPGVTWVDDNEGGVVIIEDSPGPFDRPIPLCRYDARGLETPLPHKPFSCLPSPPPTPTPQPRTHPWLII